MVKTNLEYVQELVETRITSLDEKLDSSIKHLSDKIDTNNANIIEILGIIREQVLKTNGRVLKAEADIQDLYKRESTHLVSCPHATEFKGEINSIKTKLEKNDEDNFLNKVLSRYPKQIGFGVIVYGLLTIGALVIGVYEFKQALVIFKVEQTK